MAFLWEAILNTLAELRSGSLKGCKRLQLVEQLTEFPSEILTLADSLEVLDLSNNLLCDLPDEFAKLTKLKRVFLSFNQFKHIPKVLAKCPELIMIAFKGNQITEFAEHSVPKQTQWLILTDNSLSQLPHSFGELTQLKKLALAGNKLTQLPNSMQQCKNLELIRLSANELTELDEWLFELPKLSWLAFAGNQFNRARGFDHSILDKAGLTELSMGKVLGQGASGVIYLAAWQQQQVAAKLFKGDVTSDGYPLDELHCCIQAGVHANIIRPIAYIEEPEQLGLVMELIAEHFSNLGLPPSLTTCTRDTFTDDCQYNSLLIIRVAKQMAAALLHLHQHKVSHGDIYAHNTMIDEDGQVLFGDFGAATDLNCLSDALQKRMELIEVRAFGCLIDDLLTVVTAKDELACHLADLAAQCMDKNLDARPDFESILAKLGSYNSF